MTNNSLSGKDHMTSSDIITGDRSSSTVASSLGGGVGGAVGGTSIPEGVVSTALPIHRTRAVDLGDSMQQLMLAYGIRGVSVHYYCNNVQYGIYTEQIFALHTPAIAWQFFLTSL